MALEQIRPLPARVRLCQDIDGVRRVLDHHGTAMREMVAAFQQRVANAGEAAQPVFSLQ